MRVVRRNVTSGFYGAQELQLIVGLGYYQKFMIPLLPMNSYDILK